MSCCCLRSIFANLFEKGCAAALEADVNWLGSCCGDFLDKGSIVMVDFTGKELSTNKIFDTTDEKIARENGLWNERAVFRPVPVIVGEGEVIKGLDEELEKMGEGEEKTITVEPAKAFGERNPEMVGVVPLDSFRQNKMAPYVGLIVEINGAQGKVQSISGGRVRVDFNNSLAGKSIEYRVKVIRELKGTEEKFDALLQKYLPFKEKAEFRIKGNEAFVKLPSNAPKEIEPLKDAFAKLMAEKIKEIKKVSFVEGFEGESAGRKEAEAQQDMKIEEKKEAHKHPEKAHQGHAHTHVHKEEAKNPKAKKKR